MSITASPTPPCRDVRIATDPFDILVLEIRLLFRPRRVARPPPPLPTGQTLDLEPSPVELDDRDDIRGGFDEPRRMHCGERSMLQRPWQDGSVHKRRTSSHGRDGTWAMTYFILDIGRRRIPHGPRRNQWCCTATHPWIRQSSRGRPRIARLGRLRLISGALVRNTVSMQDA